MATPGKMFKCTKCGNVAVIVKKGKNPKIGCCGQAMKEVKSVGK